MPQFQFIREATEAFGFLAIDKKGYEADDILPQMNLLADEAMIRNDINPLGRFV